MEIEFGNFPSLVILTALSMFVALPVKLTAGLLGARETGLVRSFFAIIVPVAIVVLLYGEIPPVVMAFPFILFFSVMFFLKTGFIGAVGISIISAVVYYLVVTNFVSGITIQ